MARLLLAAAFLLAAASCDEVAPPDPADPPSETDPPAAIGCDGQGYPSLEQTPYVLPFPIEATYRMNLGNCSNSYHASGRADQYAYDFAMAIGEAVSAARAGRVVHVEESGIDGRTTPNNLVVVDHGDGTFGQYMHLTLEGADVAVGETVARGDAIGRSGNTGLAGYPHLHFVVTRGGWRYPYTSTPVTFSNALPRDAVLREGVTYRATAYP